MDWNRDVDHKLLIAQAIGYMLKVIKSGKDIRKYKNEFNAIKHGDYDKFLEYIKEPNEFVVQWSDGVIKTENFSQQSGDCDFTMILSAGPSIKKFILDCYSEYGDVIDNDINSKLFCRCAAFEISLRNHNNIQRGNKNVPWTKLDLVDVIKELCQYKNISHVDESFLQEGRKFLNMVKGHKPNFSSWNNGVNAFNVAWEVRNRYNLKLV